MKIELLYVPGCANIDNARQLLRSSLLELGLVERIEEKEGSYPSPSPYGNRHRGRIRRVH